MKTVMSDWLITMGRVGFLLVDNTPTIGTQKIPKHMMFANAIYPRNLREIYDLRALKRRGCNTSGT